ncbi:MAG: hypothetical protein IJ454_04700 [Clostridia bacterium]|nr:hypothetical protein [Clostridia bacterium]
MKNMKKIIASILALVMMLSLPSMGVAYYTGAAAEGAQYPEDYIMALNTLYGLGVLPDNTPDKYESDVTRAQFAEFAGALLGGRKPANIAEPADGAVTVGEAAQILIDGTENTIRAERYGYMALASQMGITHGLARMQDYDKLTYGAVVQMLYNSMRITPGNIVSISDTGSEYTFDSDYTVLSEYLNVDYRSGFVTADSFWSLNPGQVTDENNIVINGQSFELRYAGLDDYVGFYVNYYYSEDDNMILAVEKSTKSSKVIIDSDDVSGFDNNTYTCYVDGRDKDYKLADGAYIITNFVPDMSTNVDMCPANSDIILVDGNGDNKYDTVFLKTYTEIEVAVMSADDLIISGRGAGTYVFSEDIPARVYLNGKKVDYSSITSGIHASLVLEPAKEGEKQVVREIYLSDSKVSGEVTSISGDESDMTVTIGETEYKVSQGATNIKNITLGLNAEFMLNFRGEIANFDSMGGAGGFGYLMDVGRDNGLSKPAQMQIFTSEGKITIYELTSKCKVDDKLPEGEILDMFRDVSGETVQQLIWYETNSKGQITNITIPLEDGSGLSYDDYRLYTVIASEGTVVFGESANSFNEKALVSDNTIIFNVPKTNSSNEREYQIGTKPVSNYYKAYSFRKNDPFVDVVVSKRQTAMPDYGVCGGPGPEIKKNEAGNYCIVKDYKKYYVDEYNGYFDMIDFVDSATGKTITKLLADNALYVAFGTPSAQGEVIEYTVGSMDLRPGDIFQYTLNTSDELGTIHKVYDASEGSLVKGKWSHTTNSGNFDYTVTTNFGGWASAYIRAIQGYAVDASEDYLALTRSAPADIATIDRSELEFFKPDKYTYVYEFIEDGKFTEVKKITLGQITPAFTEDEHLVLTTASGGRARIVVVYKTAK